MVSTLTVLVGIVMMENYGLLSKIIATSQSLYLRREPEVCQGKKLENLPSAQQPTDMERDDLAAGDDNTIMSSAGLFETPDTGAVEKVAFPTIMTSKGTSGESTRVPEGHRNEVLSVGDANVRIPMGLLILAWILGLVYVAAKFFILVEDVIELRSLPKSAYQSVEWSDLLPHFS